MAAGCVQRTGQDASHQLRRGTTLPGHSVPGTSSSRDIPCNIEPMRPATIQGHSGLL